MSFDKPKIMCLQIDGFSRTINPDSVPIAVFCVPTDSKSLICTAYETANVLIKDKYSCIPGVIIL